MLDLNISHKVAAFYLDSATRTDAPMRDIYACFNAEVHEQYMRIVATNLNIIPTTDLFLNVYPTPGAIARDVLYNNRLYVLTLFNPGHGLITPQQNFEFRAVHDIYGHVLPNNPLGHFGEEKAYRAHKRMFSPIAAIALATETRAQNCAYHFGQGADTFQEQKAIILPEELRQ